ncbi:MAG: Gfo/Idh/MocA family oxidoreductase [Clostridia bacterium]|nr:Gfo/Idh/MocA family oxidoreductase [Clostridia bacterium]
MNEKELRDFFASIKKPSPAAEGEDFCFAAAYLDHGHIYGMTAGLAAAGGKLALVVDRDPERGRALAEKYGAKYSPSFDDIFEDRRIRLVASAAIPSERGPLGCEVMRRGLDYFTDKAPFTTLAQLEEAWRVSRGTGRHYFVNYSERLGSECALLAGYLIRAGVIGRVVNVIGTGPHRLNAATRPAWFFEREKTGGILIDIGSHQVEQFLYYADCDEAKVVSSAVGNFSHPEYPGFDDFGDMRLAAANGATGYHRVDWFTPDGLSTWGDGRCFIEGTEGFIELRKFSDLTRGRGDRLFLVNGEGEFSVDARGTTGFPFFSDLIRDSMEGTDRAMPAAHAFAAARLSLIAQRDAANLTPRNEHGA